MKKDLSKVKCMVIDHGISFEFAVKLAQTYGEVRYHTPATQGNALPKINMAKIGTGFPGIVLSDTWLPKDWQDIDLFAFPYVGFGFEADWLRAQGKAVWGSGTGEALEQDRVMCKNLLKSVGLPVGPFEVVVGVTALRKYLKEHKDQYVKISKFRGAFETFSAKSYALSEMRLDKVQHDLGPFAEKQEFIVEAALPDKVELGTDLYNIVGQYPTQALLGIEIKDRAYVGTFRKYQDFPEPLRRVNDRLAPWLKSKGYAGFLSTEVRIGKDHAPYLVDSTCRQPSPPGEIMLEEYKNLAEIVFAGAHGVCVDPDPLAKFAVQLIIRSTWALEEWQSISFPDSLRKYVKLHNAVLEDGRYYIAPQPYGLDTIAAILGFGRTREEAIEQCKEVAEQVEGESIEIPVEAFDKADGELEKSEKMGIKMM